MTVLHIVQKQTMAVFLFLMIFSIPEVPGRSVDRQLNTSNVYEYGDYVGYSPLPESGLYRNNSTTRVIPMVEWQAEDIPHPLKDPRACGRIRPGATLFCNPSFILSPSEGNQ